MAWPFRTDNKEYDFWTVGVIGTSRGVGVTHFTVLAANFLTGVRRRKTAALEMSGHGDFAGMFSACKGLRDAQSAREILNVRYYPAAGAGELLKCRNERLGAVVMDCGTVKQGNWTEFLRCDRQFVVVGLSEWQIGAFLNFEEIRGRSMQNRRYLAAFGSEQSRREVKKRLKIGVQRIPFSEDAFEIDHRLIKFFEQIL